jgi:hypothetical protein
MPVSLSCPSCNTAFALPAMPAERRVECPRCHDVFPVRGVSGDEGEESATVSHHSPLATHHSPPDPQSPNRGRLALVAAAVALVAAVAVFVLNRGSKEPQFDPGPQRPAHLATPPTELRGLAYLPADTNIVFAAQPGPFVAYAKRTGQDAGELVAKAGVPRLILDIANDLGLSLDQIDHIAGGTHIADGETFDPRLTLTLVLREPVANEEEFLRRLKARRQSGGRDRFDASLSRVPVAVARVSPTVWVFGLGLGSDPARNLEAVDRGYEVGGKQLPQALAETMASRVPADAAAWLATNDERWAAKGGVKLVVGEVLKRPEWLAVLARGRAGMAALSLGDEPRLKLYVKTADDATGQRARDFFKTLDPKATTSGAGADAQYDAPIDPATAYATLQQLFSAAKK